MATHTGMPNLLCIFSTWAGQVRAAGLQIFKAGHAQLRLGAAAVVLERAHRGNDHNGGGLDAGQAALDVEEFFRAQVRAEARLSNSVIG